jgi:hypothetical protein
METGEETGMNQTIEKNGMTAMIVMIDGTAKSGMTAKTT